MDAYHYMHYNGLNNYSTVDRLNEDILFFIYIYICTYIHMCTYVHVYEGIYIWKCLFTSSRGVQED